MHGPGSTSYMLLTVLLHYAPTRKEQALVSTQYNQLIDTFGSDVRQLDGVLAGAIMNGLIDNRWPWDDTPRGAAAIPSNPFKVGDSALEVSPKVPDTPPGTVDEVDGEYIRVVWSGTRAPTRGHHTHFKKA